MRRVASVILAATMFLASKTLATPPNVPPSPVRHTIPKDDVCLAWAIDDEARGEPARGQKAVYDVIQHRMTVQNMTACEVVKQPKQFSGYRRGKKLVADGVMLQRLDKVRKMPPVVPNAWFFHSKKVRPSWAAKMKKVMTIGLHSFYVKPQPIKEKHK